MVASRISCLLPFFCSSGGLCVKSTESLRTKKIISFSLWGDDAKYTSGALENLRMSKSLYQGWTCRYYIDENTVPEETVISLKEGGAELVYQGNRIKSFWHGLFWRFYAASDSTVDIMISRDCDSRLTERDRIAVEEWLNSNKDFHIIRDHIDHKTKILGGLWGVRNGLLSHMDALIEQYCCPYELDDDQRFLRRIIYPRVKRNCFVHDEFFHYRGEKPRKITRERENYEFIGAPYNPDNTMDSRGYEKLRHYYFTPGRSLRNKLFSIVEKVWIWRN